MVASHRSRFIQGVCSAEELAKAEGKIRRKEKAEEVV